MKTRAPAVSGYFYPEKESNLKSFLSDAFNKVPDTDRCPKCLIVPHAGYVYSGEVAAYAFATLKSRAEVIRKVILAGPSHRKAIGGICVSGSDYFETPLGNVPVDAELREIIIKEPGIIVDDEAHRMEHSLEVQLPFLQFILGNNFKILPIVMNTASPYQLSTVFDSLWGGEETIFVISSDLSHYLSYEDANSKDNQTIENIINLKFEKIGADDACGASAISGILNSLKSRGLHPVCLNHRNSGDMSGDKDRVVGYAAFCV